MGIGNIGVSGWLIILAIVVLLFGAKKIPELAKGIGRGIKTFRSEMDNDEIDVKTSQKIEEKTKENSATNTNEDKKS